MKVSAPVDEDLLYTFMKYIVSMIYSSTVVLYQFMVIEIIDVFSYCHSLTFIYVKVYLRPCHTLYLFEIFY